MAIQEKSGRMVEEEGLLEGLTDNDNVANLIFLIGGFKSETIHH